MGYIIIKMISTGLRNMMARNIAVVQNGMFAAQAAPLRNFAKKADGAEATVTEEEDAAVERETVAEVAEPVKAAPVVKAAMSGAAWSAGDIPQIHSVEGDVCPVAE